MSSSLPRKSCAPALSAPASISGSSDRGKQHHGHEGEALAEAAQRVEPAPVGEGEIEEDEVRGIGDRARGGERRDVREPPVAPFRGRLERGLREMRVHGVVLDEEDREGGIGVVAHGIPSTHRAVSCVTPAAAGNTLPDR